MQDQTMKYDPATGMPKPYPSHAGQWRKEYPTLAWLYNPWSGYLRRAEDVGSDVFGLLIMPSNDVALAAAKVEQATKQRDQRIAELEAENAAWREKAKVWMASPEAQKQLAGYRELADKCASLEAERDALKAALIMIYEKWEDGDPVYDDPDYCENYIGNCVRLDGEEENQILALIPKERDALLDKALRFDLDQSGIEKREAEAV